MRTMPKANIYIIIYIYTHTITRVKTLVPWSSHQNSWSLRLFIPKTLKGNEKTWQQTLVLINPRNWKRSPNWTFQDPNWFRCHIFPMTIHGHPAVQTQWYWNSLVKFGEIPMFDGWIMWKIPIFASLIPILRRSSMGFWKRSRRPGRPAGAVRKDASGEAVFPRYQMMLMITYDTYIYNMCIYINMYIYIYIYTFIRCILNIHILMITMTIAILVTMMNINTFAV